MQIKNTLGQNVLADIKCLTYVRKKFYARHVLATAFFIGKPDLMRKPFSSIGNEIQHCAGTEGNDRGKHGMVRQHFEDCLNEVSSAEKRRACPIVPTGSALAVFFGSFLLLPKENEQNPIITFYFLVLRLGRRIFSCHGKVVPLLCLSNPTAR